MLKRRILRLFERSGLIVPLFRVYERQKSLRPIVLRKVQGADRALATDGLPIPPPYLITLVAGNADIDAFLESGALTAGAIHDTLRKNGLDIEQFEKILDFGCGCGRVIRYWKGHSGLYGSDYNPRLIQWCVENLPNAHYSVNGLYPPLTYDDNSFQFIYALSVLTHLPEQLQFAWIAELSRVLKPGGYLLITTHGEAFLHKLMPEDLRRYQSGELVVLYDDAAGTNMCAAFHPKEYVVRTLATDYELIDHIPQGATGTGNQDIYLLRRK